MGDISSITLVFGLIMLSLSILNVYTVDSISPSFQRAEVISGLTSIFIIGISTFWKEINPRKPEKKFLEGKQGLYIDSTLKDSFKVELAWGSQLLLTATAAATLLIYWDGNTILRRGLLSNEEFEPGEICNRAIDQDRLISLVNTKLFPGRDEFNSLLNEVPSIIVYPINKRGFILIGGLTERCFTKSDEIWIKGWGDKLGEMII